MEESKNSIMPAIKELERLYRLFNEKLFSGKLDKDIRILIQTRGRKKKVIGFHAPKRWKNTENGDYVTEITLCAEDLNKHDPCEVLIHECAHNFNFQRGIADCCSNRYHNKYFKQAAEDAGLIVEQDLMYGFCITSLGHRAQAVIDEAKPALGLFKTVRLDGFVAPTYLRKFMCTCGMIIRVARVSEFSATCNNCGTPFLLSD